MKANLTSPKLLSHNGQELPDLGPSQIQAGGKNQNMQVCAKIYMKGILVFVCVFFF